MTGQVIGRDRLGALTKIGQGGQGVVYGAPNVKTKFAASMVYKEYKAQTLAAIDFGALAAMPALVEESLSYAEAERLISCAAWPCALVEDGGASTGFVMPAIPEQFFIGLTTVKGVSRVTAEFQHLLNHSSVLAARGIAIDDAQRYALLREMASGLAFLHKHGVCVGDISPKNLLFSLTPREAVYFIDCDAMRINGVSALRQVETPGWDAPSGEELATISTDSYKLGLLALRLLAGDHDTKNPGHLPATTPDLLCQIITDTLTKEPHSRPQPGAWSYVLGHAIEHAQHQKKTAAAAAAQAGAALEAPAIPVLHSRSPEPAARSTASRPPPPPAWAPPAWAPPAPSASKSPVWIGIGVAGVVLAALIAVMVVVLANRNTGSSSSAPAFPTGTLAYPPNSYPTATTNAADTPTVSVPPPMVQTPDSYGESCPTGYQLPDRSGWATNSGRGTDETSCQFARNVLRAYWDSYPSPSRDTRQVIAGSRVACPVVRANASMPVACSGNNFIMNCAVYGTDPWITCSGGNDAKVYIY